MCFRRHQRVPNVTGHVTESRLGFFLSLFFMQLMPEAVQDISKMAKRDGKGKQAWKIVPWNFKLTWLNMKPLFYICLAFNSVYRFGRIKAAH